MKIGALLIGNAAVKPPLKGVEQDLKAFSTYLKSNRGGAWEDPEILILRDADQATIRAAVRAYANYDYVLTLVAAHGEYRTSINDTVFYTSDTEYMRLSDLYANSKRQVIISDVCRKIIDDRLVKSAAMDSALESFSESSRQLSRKNYRDRFIELISQTSEGVIRFYSCSPNQAAGEDSRGGVYAQSLLEASSRSTSTINVYQAHEAAKPRTTSRNPPQLPTEDLGRRRDFPPFAIVL